MNQLKTTIGIIYLATLALGCNATVTTNDQLEDYSQTQIDSLKMIECDNLLSELQKIKADTLRKVKHLPTNLEESLVVLDSIINPKMKEWIICLPDGEYAIYVHHGFGTYLRNNWGLWGNSKLAESLSEMGIFHPDDMSGIILTSYQRKLKGEEMKIEEQIEFYQDFWRDNGLPVDSILNERKEQKERKSAG